MVATIDSTIDSTLDSKMNWKGRVPGKTFLFGEYAVLKGGPAVVLATAPEFLLSFSEDDQQMNSNQAQLETSRMVFHPNSPTGRLLARYPSAASKGQFAFTNPYAAGGFGASSAEFVLALRFLQSAGRAAKFSDKNQIQELLELYFSLEDSNKRSSGSDLILQWTGCSVFLERRQNSIEKLNWPFPDVSFSIFSTGIKVQTHEHLEAFNESSLEELVQQSEALRDAFLDKDFFHFQSHWIQWREILQRKGLALEKNSRTIQALEEIPQVLARGCGAMGADVILALHPAEIAQQVRQKGEALGLRFQCGRSDLKESQEPVVDGN